MSVGRRHSSAVTESEEEQTPPLPQVPAPISRLILLQHTIAQPVFAAFLAGGVAGAVSRTVVSPLERLKILFQIQSAGRNEYKLSVPQGLAKMWRDEGWRGFMRGNGTNCIRIVPYSAVQFSSYNVYKRVSKIIHPATSLQHSLHRLTLVHCQVCGVLTRCGINTFDTTRLRWSCRNHFRRLYVSSRYSQNSALRAVCVICDT